MERLSTHAVSGGDVGAPHVHVEVIGDGLHYSEQFLIGCEVLLDVIYARPWEQANSDL